MCGRENHKEEWTGFLDSENSTLVYDAVKANKELDKMKAVLKNKQRSIDKLISEKYELTCKLREYETNGTFNEMRNRINELEKENNQLKQELKDTDHLLDHH